MAQQLARITASSAESLHEPRSTKVRRARCHGRTLTGLPCRREASFRPERALYMYCHDHRSLWARFEPGGSARTAATPLPMMISDKPRKIREEGAESWSLHVLPPELEGLADVESVPLQNQADGTDASRTDASQVENDIPCTPQKQRRLTAGSSHTPIRRNVPLEDLRQVSVALSPLESKATVTENEPIGDNETPQQVASALEALQELSPSPKASESQLERVVCYKRRAMIHARGMDAWKED